MQVITITPAGQVSGLQRKPGQGLDLTKLGRAKVERVSEIVWHEDHQRWFVEIKTGPLAGEVLTAALCDKHGFDAKNFVGDWWSGAPDNRIVWASYDDAVRGEVAFLDHVRLRGIF